MERIVQCVPNFSESRDTDIFDALIDAAYVPGVILADFSANESHNRCVATLLGEPSAIAEASFAMARVAVERIDLTKHSGVHPRVGALDVLPFVPLRQVTMDECVDVALSVGARIASELSVPVYLYDFASPDRFTLPQLRKGGLEGLTERMATRPPDFGSAKPHPTAGVTLVGARNPLLAYNVNLDTDDVRVARRIAKRIREFREALPGVRALGLLVAGKAQVSCNITDTSLVSLLTVNAAVLKFAKEEGVGVEDSELIGGITTEDLVHALNDALDSEIRISQVLDAWLPAFLSLEDG